MKVDARSFLSAAVIVVQVRMRGVRQVTQRSAILLIDVDAVKCPSIEMTMSNEGRRTPKFL